MEEFSIQLKSKLRNFVGELIDQLKEVFVGGIDDVKEFMKIILMSKF